IEDVGIDAEGVIHGKLVNKTAGPLQGTLIAALYNEQNTIDSSDIQQISFTAAGEASAFSAQFDQPIVPKKHTIKLFVWDSLTSKKPLSNVMEVSPYGLTETTESKINPYAFYVGRVARTYSESENKALTADLDTYIDTTNKRIKSVTDELDWDYGQGVIRLNTPKSQGATGILNAVSSVELDNVVIESGNAFGTVMVISLDDLPIASSKKLLIQAVTEDKSYGFESETVTEDGVAKQKIVSLGEGPMNVRDIDASVLLKGMTDINRIYALDPNGYVKEEVQGTAAAGGFQIPLRPDALYTLVEREGLTDPYVPGTQPEEDPVYVWWEGEDAVETNFPATADFSADTFPQTRHLLSGSDWLAISNVAVDPDNPPFSNYEVEVPEDAAYTFFVRKFWLHGPFDYRWDGGEWKSIGRDITLLDSVSFRQFTEANWISAGSETLTKGKHLLEIKLQQEAENSNAAFDSFILSKQPFMPSGLLRPGEKLNRAEEGFWAFEPDIDPFNDNAALDLRYLNEDTAGQSGYVQRQKDKLLLGDGQEARFWAVNAGAETINLEKGDVDYFAKQLAKRGVNMVRIHGMIFDENGEITDKALDRYQYFVHAMKQEGIYVNLSYYFVLWWDMTKAEAFKQPGDEFFDWNKQPFGLLFFDKTQQELYKKGVRKLLLTPNPYENGLPLGKDPAVAIIETQNEDSYFFFTFSDWKFPDNIRRELSKMFGGWLKDEYGSLDAAYDAWGPLSKVWNDEPENGLMEVEGASNLPWATGNGGDDKRRRDILRFLTEEQRLFYEDMNRFYKEDIGTQSIITASNWITADPAKMEALERYTYAAADMVDRHAYTEPSHTAFNNENWTLHAGDTYIPTPIVQHPDMNPVKVVHNDNQPSMISEITWTNPTPYGAEGPFMISAYSSLQGIDVLDMFATGGPSWPTKWQKWPIMSPTMAGQFPGFSLMYRRGDVTEAKNVVLESSTLDSLLNLQGSKIYESLNIDDIRG
ncbi:hypothetical protein K0U00_22505, partial [Paenibacillus sepulcri]|nr:hypothetical protein [Paenibacillus sepulcri]